MKSPTPGQILYTKYPKTCQLVRERLSLGRSVLPPYLHITAEGVRNEKGFDDERYTVVTVRLTGETNSRGCWEFVPVWE